MPSPFDDLLKEFDDPIGGSEEKPPEDPLRAENLELLMKLSKKIESIAATLDPSGPKHPLYNQQLPEEARLRLKGVINDLMDVQGDLHEIEKTLLDEAEPKEAPSEPPLETPTPHSTREATPKEQPPEENFAPLSEKSFIKKETSPITPVSEPMDEKPESLKTPAPAPELVLTAPSPDLVLLEKEKRDFGTYKAKWEQVFAEDPAQRLAHPEVAAYYTQMETYFREKEAYLQQNSGT